MKHPALLKVFPTKMHLLSKARLPGRDVSDPTAMSMKVYGLWYI